MEVNSRDQGLFINKINKSKKSTVNIRMPSEYIRENHEEVNEIRFLLHNRGFYYTNTAVLH